MSQYQSDNPQFDHLIGNMDSDEQPVDLRFCSCGAERGHAGSERCGPKPVVHVTPAMAIRRDRNPNAAEDAAEALAKAEVILLRLHSVFVAAELGQRPEDLGHEIALSVMGIRRADVDAALDAIESHSARKEKP